MKRRPYRVYEEVSLSLEQVAALFNVETRTVHRWCSLGLPRAADGRFPFPLCGLWINSLKHHYDRRCDRHPEADLLFVLGRAIELWPDRLRTIADSQQLLRQLSGFQLS